MYEKIVIIGGSHAGYSVIETLRREGFRGRLTLISEEKIPVYSPTALPYLLWDKGRDQRYLRPVDSFRGIEVIEERAVSIDPEKALILLRNGKKIHYDRVVIATGASAKNLPLRTSKKNEVLTLRRIQDLVSIEEKARKSRKILIIGAGLIGLHLAQVFSGKKKEVHVIELKSHILPGVIHPELAITLKSLFEQQGIRISVGVSLSEIGEKEAKLSSGDKINMDLTIAAVGIRPNLEVVEGLPVNVNEGILVNGRMETNIPGVYACGDVAEYTDFFTGKSRLNPNVISAAEQGRCVGEHLLGKGTDHPGLISINTFHCFGLNLLSLGKFIPEPEDQFLEENDPKKMVYKRMVFRQNQLKGVITLNVNIDGGIFYRLVKERISLRGLEEKLLKDPLLWGKWISGKVFRE